ncbi:MAG TPA: ROK family protein [Gemmatimonadaceae bacterium]|nr:ROK family protein [Gemmatimonadaceae bacterium]
MAFIGIDLGGTKLAAAAFTAGGELLHREATPLADRRGTAVGALIVERIGKLAEKHGLDGAGVCVPGLYRASRGTVWAPNIPGWDDYPLRDELRSALGDTSLTIDSDRAAYILGETWRGAAAGARDAIFLAVGTGIGAGILTEGRVLRGHGDVAGAIGWLALDRPYAPRYRTHGCFEDQASGPGLVRVARDLMDGDASYRGALRPHADALDAGAIFAAYDQGDTVAAKVIDNAIELWGMACANLVSLFNPEIVVFGGGVFGPATRFLDRVRAEAKRWAQPIAIEQVHFVATALGGDAGLIGAGRLAMLGQGDT